MRRFRRRDLAVEGLERRDCPAGISIGIDPVSVGEGTTASGMARLTVTLSERASSAVTVDWATVDGTTEEGAATAEDKDYRPASGTLVFAPGQKSKTIAVLVYADAKAEPNEAFSVKLSNPVNATLLKDRDVGIVTIRDDDVDHEDDETFEFPKISVSAPAAPLPERNVGRSDATFTVSLSTAVDFPVSVEFATADGSGDNAAKATDGDYVKTSGKLTFAPGETTKNVSVGVLGDARIEKDETFQIVLSGPVNATLDTSSATATILNDDARPAPRPVVSVAAASVSEGDAGETTATFEVRLSSAISSPVTVTYATADGTARVADGDYRGLKGTLVFAPGDTVKMVSVAVLGDKKAEANETFTLALVSASGASVARNAKAAFTILDDDTSPVISASNVTLTEGNSGSAPCTFTITLNKAWSQAVTVSYATRDGSAKVSDADYVSTSGTLIFEPGQTSKTVDVNVNGDTKAETDETFSLVLSSPVNATVAATGGTARIRNDDSGEVPGFQITVDYLGSVRQSIREACDWAAERWSQVITGDLPGVQDSEQGIFIDDLRITVQEGLLGGDNNGPGGALANAGPVQFRPGAKGLPWDAVAGIDPFDASDPQLRNIVLHEFGHALGFGISGGGITFYSQFVVGSGFTGPNAVREYNLLFENASTSVPLETGGGGGTAGAHWSENVFRTELMTGFSENAGVPMPLSRLTVAAMEDMGYTVNYTAADAFSKPSQTAGNAAASSAAASPVQRPTAARGRSPFAAPLPVPTRPAATKPAALQAESQATGFFASLGTLARSTRGALAAAASTRLDQRTFARLA
jgi:hypothetical protein